MDQSTKYKHYIDTVNTHLLNALAAAQAFQRDVQQEEGDSDLFRALSFYLTPNLEHWITGSRAGNIRELNEILNRRAVDAKKANKNK